MKKVFTLSLVIGLATMLIAKPNVPIGDMKNNLAKMAGEKGMFAKNEIFPKDYFLIPKNLPFLVGLTLHHPMSSTLKLSPEQIEKIQKIKGNTVPKVIKSAKEIKALELNLHTMIENDAKASQLEEEIDKIALLKATLTKKHLGCILEVKTILSEQQRKTLDAYAGKKIDKHKKASNHPVKELLPLPEFLKVVIQKADKLKLTDEQKQRIQKEIKAVFPEKIHGGMDEAKTMEIKIQNAVLKEHKTKTDLKTDIANLAVLKMLITSDHIDALNILNDILNDEQFKKVLELSKH